MGRNGRDSSVGHFKVKTWAEGEGKEDGVGQKAVVKEEVEDEQVVRGHRKDAYESEKVKEMRRTEGCE